MNATSLNTPDVTPVQALVAAVGGLITTIVVLVNSFGWYDITGEQALAAGAVWASFGSVLVIADAIIRNGRSRAYTNAPKGVVADEAGKGAPGA